MPYQAVSYHHRGRVGRITLNRPEAGNAIDVRLAQELRSLCAELRQDEGIVVVTITGAGDTFCVGTDSQLVLEGVPIELLSVSSAIASLPFPVIAAINGDALGQGLELALACDLRIAAATARLGLPQITSGLIPWDGGTQRLPRLIGKTRALEMILLGELVGAEEAYRMGLVNKVVAREELTTAVTDLAEGMAAYAPLALKYAKEAVDQGMEMTLEQGLRLAADLYSQLQTTRDRREGIIAFREKRRPRFRGK